MWSVKFKHDFSYIYIYTEEEPKTIEQFAEIVQLRGRSALYEEYADIKSREPRILCEQTRLWEKIASEMQFCAMIMAVLNYQ